MRACVHACVSAGVRECRCALVCVWDTHARTHTQTHTHTHTHTQGRFCKVVKAICGIARISMSLKRKARDNLESGSKASTAPASASYKAARQPPA